MNEEEKQTDQTPPVLHLQSAKKKSYTLVQTQKLVKDGFPGKTEVLEDSLECGNI